MPHRWRRLNDQFRPFTSSDVRSRYLHVLLVGPKAHFKDDIFEGGGGGDGGAVVGVFNIADSPRGAVQSVSCDSR